MNLPDGWKSWECLLLIQQFQFKTFQIRWEIPWDLFTSWWKRSRWSILVLWNNGPIYRSSAEFYKNISFTNECTFFLNGNVNKHNCCYRSDDDSHIFRKSHIQYREKTNVWTDILGDSILISWFVNSNLTSEIYLNVLDEPIDGLITESLKN